MAIVALRKQARRRVRRSGAAKAIMGAAPGRPDPRDPDVAVALVRSGAGRQMNAIARTGLFGDALVAESGAHETRAEGARYLCSAAGDCRLTRRADRANAILRALWPTPRSVGSQGVGPACGPAAGVPAVTPAPSV